MAICKMESIILELAMSMRNLGGVRETYKQEEPSEGERNGRAIPVKKFTKAQPIPKSGRVGNVEVRFVVLGGAKSSYVSKALAEKLKKCDEVRVTALRGLVTTVGNSNFQVEEKLSFVVEINGKRFPFECRVYPLSAGHEDAINIGRVTGKKHGVIHDMRTNRMRLVNGDQHLKRASQWVDLDYGTSDDDQIQGKVDRPAKRRR